MPKKRFNDFEMWVKRCILFELKDKEALRYIQTNTIPPELDIKDMTKLDQVWPRPNIRYYQRTKAKIIEDDKDIQFWLNDQAKNKNVEIQKNLLEKMGNLEKEITRLIFAQINTKDQDKSFLIALLRVYDNYTTTISNLNMSNPIIAKVQAMIREVEGNITTARKEKTPEQVLQELENKFA